MISPHSDFSFLRRKILTIRGFPLRSNAAFRFAMLRRTPVEMTMGDLGSITTG
jgi:hypothetical protein